MDANNKDGKHHKTSVTLRRVQAATGLIISSFTIAHLSNHFAMHFGLEAHNALFQRFRKIYTHPVAESILLGSILVHSVLAAVRYKGAETDPRRRLFQLAGWFLVMVMPGHIFATRILGPRVNMKEYDVTYAAMAARMLPYVFIPYYIMMSISGAYHTYYGMAKAGAVLNVPALKDLPVKGWLGNGVSTVLTLAAASSVLAVAGVYFRYEMVYEQSLILSSMKVWPKFLTRHITPPGAGEWFAKWSF